MTLLPSNAAKASFDEKNSQNHRLTLGAEPNQTRQCYTKHSMLSARKIKLDANKKIVTYGDSISGIYPAYTDYLKKYTGAQAERCGFRGTQVWYQAQQPQLNALFDCHPDLILFMPGGNDDGRSHSVGTFSGYVASEPYVKESDLDEDFPEEGINSCFIQGVDYVIRKIKSEYDDFSKRAGVTDDDTKLIKKEKLDAVSKPILVVLSPLKQQRFNADNEFSKPENWYRKRDAVAEACLKNEVLFIDLMTKTGFDMSQEPYWTKTEFKNNGVYYDDGLHPNRYGFQVIVETIIDELGI